MEIVIVISVAMMKEAWLFYSTDSTRKLKRHRLKKSEELKKLCKNIIKKNQIQNENIH